MSSILDGMTGRQQHSLHTSLSLEKKTRPKASMGCLSDRFQTSTVWGPGKNNSLRSSPGGGSCGFDLLLVRDGPAGSRGGRAPTFETASIPVFGAEQRVRVLGDPFDAVGRRPPGATPLNGQKAVDLSMVQTTLVESEAGAKKNATD